MATRSAASQRALGDECQGSRELGVSGFVFRSLGDVPIRSTEPHASFFASLELARLRRHPIRLRALTSLAPSDIPGTRGGACWGGGRPTPRSSLCVSLQNLRSSSRAAAAGVSISRPSPLRQRAIQVLVDEDCSAGAHGLIDLLFLRDCRSALVVVGNIPLAIVERG